MYALKKISVPGMFQGRARKNHYFEGWYFKITDASGAKSLAFIPGISYGEDIGDRHAFIQVLDMSRSRSEYFRFEISTFKSSEKKFEIAIGENLFASGEMLVSLDGGGSRYSGKLVFSNSVRFPRGVLARGVMGPFRWAPFMECYHDVVSMRLSINGAIRTDEGIIDFTGGTGYIEKDWGTSFPKSWVWLQCNHFNEPGASFMLSYARVPFAGSSFRGLISFIGTESSFYRMATYNGAKVTSLDVKNNELSLIAESKKRALNVRVELEPGCALKAPRKGLMDTDITEALSSRIDVMLINKKGRMLFQGKGKVAGVELGGDTSDLIP